MLKVSVALATYNGEKFIQEQLESIMNQTYQVDEIIICDDASSDKTIEIITKFLSSFHIYFKLIKHDVNKGVVSSFKDAIAETTGDIILLCDQDDVWFNNKVEVFVSAFCKRQDVLLCFSNALIVDYKLKSKGMLLWDSIDYRPFQGDLINSLKVQMFKRNVFTGMCIAIKKEMMNNDIWFSENMLHDEMLGWQALKRNAICCIEKPLVLYRQHNRNVVGSSNTRKFESIALTKYHIRNSLERSIKKYYELLELFDNDKMIKLKIIESLQLYEWRLDIEKENTWNSIKKCFVFWEKGYYKKYTSKTEHAILKDIFCIFFKNISC